VQQSLADFELLRRIGDGSYSHVVLARHRASNKEYALKVVDKQYIVRCAPVERQAAFGLA
jgi:serine/threonine protein kinase